MKPDGVILENQDKFDVVKQIPDETHKLISSIVPYKGHTLFEINCTTGEVIPAEYENINASYTTGGVKRKVLVKPNCLYISCLNKKSAVKKYFAWLDNKVQQQKNKAQ